MLNVPMKEIHIIYSCLWIEIELVVKILCYCQLEGQHNCSLELFPNLSIDRKQERE